jgi:hypothetical protein
VSLNLFNKLSLSIPCSTEIKGKESLNSSQFAFVLTKLLLNSTFIRFVTYEIATQHNSSHHSKSSYINRIDRSPITIMPITQENKIRSWILEMERFCLPSFDQQSYKIHYICYFDQRFDVIMTISYTHKAMMNNDEISEQPTNSMTHDARVVHFTLPFVSCKFHSGISTSQ